MLVFLATNGMEGPVFNAPTEEPGTLLLSHAPAHLVQWRLKTDADFNSNAQVVKNGTKIHGPASAH